ncbi:hypothetical protein AB6A40_005491 [Gnathostoma spinigerum]|uniref:Uncharacterized protein n=1 Tax=Gnathostoma spinigerum TaxID=75299 RepID=A0ABD6EQ21_9BILA
MSNATSPNPLQFISALGDLQTRCSIGANEECSTNDASHTMLDECEDELKNNAINSDDFDRHRILRLRLNTSRRLLQLPQTSKQNECLIIRATLTEIYRIHHRHCFHAVVTRCLCKQLNIEIFCGINCLSMKPSGPQEDRLTWSDFKGQLSSSQGTTHQTSTFHVAVISPLFLIVLLIVLLLLIW